MRQQLLTLDQLLQLMDPKLYLHLQKAESTNFFFFFRMLLVWFKREFEWVDCLRLWEALWTDHLSSNFHIFVALAILEKHRDVIMAHLHHFDEVLKYGMSFPCSYYQTWAKLLIVNELSNTIDLIPTLSRAEALFHRFEKKVEAIDKKYNFPQAPVRQRTTRPTSQANTTTSPARDSSATATGASPSGGTGSKPSNKPNTKPDSEATSVQIITPDLRKLLSREVEVMDAKEVRQHALLGAK